MGVDGNTDEMLVTDDITLSKHVYSSHTDQMKRDGIGGDTEEMPVTDDITQLTQHNNIIHVERGEASRRMWQHSGDVVQGQSNLVNMTQKHFSCWAK